MIGLVLFLQAQQPQVAQQLAPPQGRILVAAMVDLHARPVNLGAAAAQRQQDLLMHAKFPAHVGPVAKQPHMVHGGRRLAGLIGQANALKR